MTTRTKTFLTLLAMVGAAIVGFGCWLKFSKVNPDVWVVSLALKGFTALGLMMKPAGDVPAAEKDVDVRIHLLKAPLIVPATDELIASASEGDDELHDVLSILSRRQSANTWDEFSSTYTSDSAAHLKFASSPSEGRASWEANKEKWSAHRNQTIFGVIVVSAGTMRHAFVPLTHCEYHDPVPPSAPFCIPVGFVFDPGRGWLIDEALNNTTPVLLLMNRGPVRYSTVISELKARYWREILYPESQQPTRRPTGPVNH